METNLRILMRVISWRIGGVLLLIGITWWATRDIIFGAQIGLTYNIVRTVTHFFHEYTWVNKINWGKKKKIDLVE